MQGIYPSFAEENVNIFVIPQGGGGVDSSRIAHECLQVYMVHMYFRWQFEEIPAYMMSQRWLRTGAFLTVLVKDAPRIENSFSQFLISCPLHLHVIGSILGYRCKCGEQSFS